VTAHGTKPLRIHVLGADAAQLAAVAAELELRTYPALELVGADVQSGATTLELMPKAPLVDGWYILGLKRLPPKVDTAFSDTPMAPPKSRFHTASHPIPTRAIFCNKGMSPVDRVYVWFSEPVTNATDTVTVEEIATGKKCVAYDASGAGPYYYESGLDCAGFSGTAVRVTIKPGITSASGVAVTTLGNETTIARTFDLPALRRVENDLCVVGEFE